MCVCGRGVGEVWGEAWEGRVRVSCGVPAPRAPRATAAALRGLGGRGEQTIVVRELDDYFARTRAAILLTILLILSFTAPVHTTGPLCPPVQ